MAPDVDSINHTYPLHSTSTTPHSPYYVPTTTENCFENGKTPDQVEFPWDLTRLLSEFRIIMNSSGGSSLPPLTQEALDALTTALPNDETFTEQHAYTILAEELDLKQPAAADIIERLYMRGHLYKVDGDFRLTDS